MKLIENTWTLGKCQPRAVSQRTFLFSKAETNWELYDPGATRAIQLIPTLRQAERVPPVAFTSSRTRIRVGCAEFAVKGDSPWLKEKDKAESYGCPYWENIQVFGNLRVKSRRRLVEAEPRFRKVPNRRRQSWSTSDDTSATDGFESEDTSQFSFDAESPIHSCSSPSTYSSGSSAHISEAEAEAEANQRGDDSTGERSEASVRASSPPEAESGSDTDLEVSPSTSYPRRTGAEFTSNHAISSESSESEVNHSEPQRGQVTKKQNTPSHRICDACQAQPLSYFYECVICVRDNSYDLCHACLEKGRWCKDRYHQLYRTRLDSRGKLRRLGGLGLVDCRPNTCLLIERLDCDKPVVFRFQDLKSRRRALYNSHPRIHSSKGLLTWPLGSGDMLFVNIEENKYFIRPTHSGVKNHWWCKPILIQTCL